MAARSRLVGWFGGTLLLAAACVLWSASISGASPAVVTRSPAYLVVANRLTRGAVVETLDAHGRVVRVFARKYRQWDVGPAEWSADRSSVVWAGRRGVMIGAVNGGDVRVLARFYCKIDNCSSPTFDLSPDGTRLLLDRVGVHGVEKLVVLSVATRRATVIASSPSGTFNVDGWSPDGRRILYTRYSNDGQSIYSTEDEEIVLARADGSHARVVLRHDQALGAGASWSPDGRRLAFDEGWGTRSDFHERAGVLDLATGRIHRIHGHAPCEVPVWAPDAQRVAASCSYGPAVTFRRDGKRLHTFRRLDAMRDVWTSAGLYMLSWRKTAVYRSPDGMQDFKLAFRMPPEQSVISLAPR